MAGVLRDVGDGTNARLATRQLERLASSLKSKHPGAAASVREGLEETLTLHGLGISGALYRTLRTTNPIENLNGSIANHSRNVKRWSNGQMVQRRVASALRDASQRFRALRAASAIRSSSSSRCRIAWRPSKSIHARSRSIRDREPLPRFAQQRSGHRRRHDPRAFGKETVNA